MNLALFDVDGTLIDSEGVYTGGMIRLLDELFGIRVPSIVWEEYEHVTDTFVISELFRRCLGREPEADELIRYRRAYVDQLNGLRERYPENFREIPGAKAALSRLASRPGWAVALATGGSRDAALTKLRWAGFDVDHLPGGFAEDGVSREDILRAAIARAAAHHGVDGFDRVISVGDGLWDLTTARTMGLEFFAIVSGNNREELVAAGATRLYSGYPPGFHDDLESGTAG